MSEFTVTITAKVACRQCNGSGFTLQTRLRDVGCEACGERGYTVERVTLDAAALIQLGNAIRTVQSAEYAEAMESMCADCQANRHDACDADECHCRCHVYGSTLAVNATW